MLKTANGNMTSRNGSSIGYTSYNLPSVINGGSGTSSSLSYGAFRNRFKQVAVTPSGTETTIYVAGLLEKVTRGSQIEYRHYIAGGKGAAAIHTRVAGGASSTYYLHRDHLGSPELITDSSGNEVVRPSFGAYGERRDGTDWSGPPSAGDLTNIANITRRGFTGHEHLDSVGLIHMNGRVYEPVAGRFLEADPYVIVGNSQGSNSYSYVLNSPLSLIDPTGLYCEPYEGMTEEEATAWITLCNDAFEETGRFMARYGEFRCPPMDLTCQQLISAIGMAAHGFIAANASGGNWDDTSSGPVFALLRLVQLQRDLDNWMRWHIPPIRKPTIIDSLSETLRSNFETGISAHAFALNFAAGINAHPSIDHLVSISTTGGIDSVDNKRPKIAGIRVTPHVRWTVLGDVPRGAHIDDGICMFVFCIGSTIAHDGSTSSLYVQAAAGLGPYAVSQSAESGIFQIMDRAACRPDYPWCKGQ